MDDQEQLKAPIASIRNKRARVVAEHILAHGFVTTEELASMYGYSHPPRAARDLRELGIPLETLKMKNSLGRIIAAYRFASPLQGDTREFVGRRTFPKQFKQRLLSVSGKRCAVCQTSLESHYLQIDHCIPYSIPSDSVLERTLQDFMLLCATCNRAKAWSCEHCPNQAEKSIEVCRSCDWASPLTYTHIATQPIRRLEIVWRSDEVRQHDELAERAKQNYLSLSEYVKRILRLLLDQ